MTGRTSTRNASASSGAKLGGFVLLLASVFAGAYAAGQHLGPITTTQSRTGGGGGSMRMGGSGSTTPGGQPAPRARLQGGRP